eukprot:m51a1_g8790 hypothetical protein (123) ;mRNA; f:224942-225310
MSNDVPQSTSSPTGPRGGGQQAALALSAELAEAREEASLLEARAAQLEDQSRALARVVFEADERLEGVRQRAASSAERAQAAAAELQRQRERERALRDRIAQIEAAVAAGSAEMCSRPPCQQ